MDPLSIAAGSAALAQLCIKLSVCVGNFVSDARAVDDNVRTLQLGLSALSEVLISVSLAWSSNPEISAAQSGPDRALWVSVKDSISRCTTVIERFQQVLNKVSPADDSSNRSILKRSVTKVKLSLNMGDIDGFRAEIDVYHRVLNIALNSINTCAIIRRDRTDGAVFERLQSIETSIESLTQKFKEGTTSSTPTLGSDTTKSLSGFLKAAKDFQSSASEYSSSGSTVKGEDSTERGGSVFGAPLSSERVNNIEGWIPAPLNEILEGPIAGIASSSGWNGPLQEVETLPQLMSVLENVAQMADRFQAVEKQKIFTKDEEICALKENCAKLEKTLVAFRTENRQLGMGYSVSVEKLEAAKMKNDELKAEVDTLKSILEKCQDQREYLENRLQRYHNEMDDMGFALIKQKEAFDQLKRVTAGLEDKLCDEKKLNERFVERLELINIEGQRMKDAFMESVTKQATDFSTKLTSLSLFEINDTAPVGEAISAPVDEVEPPSTPTPTPKGGDGRARTFHEPQVERDRRETVTQKKKVQGDTVYFERLRATFNGKR